MSSLNENVCNELGTLPGTEQVLRNLPQPTLNRVHFSLLSV